MSAVKYSIHVLCSAEFFYTLVHMYPSLSVIQGPYTVTPHSLFEPSSLESQHWCASIPLHHLDALYYFYTILNMNTIIILCMAYIIMLSKLQLQL